MLERIATLCKKHGITFAGLEKSLGFANGSIAKTNEKTQINRLKSIADFFGVTVDYLINGDNEEPTSSSGKKYYFSDETAEAAQELFDDPDLRVLFDAAKDSRPEDLRLAADMLRRLKETNIDG